MPKDYITPLQLSAAVGLTPARIYALARSGELPAKRVGRALFISIADAVRNYHIRRNAQRMRMKRGLDFSADPSEAVLEAIARVLKGE